MKDNVLNDFNGYCKIKSELSLDELAKLISEKMFGGIPFTYGKHSVWEEVPSMYIDKELLGMFIVIGGYGGEKLYQLDIGTWGSFSTYVYKQNLYEVKDMNYINLHIYHQLKYHFQNDDRVEPIYIEPNIIEWK